MARVPSIAPTEKPLSWFQRRRQRQADAYTAARDHGLKHALSIAEELAGALTAGRISGDDLAGFVDLVVNAINPLEFAPCLKPKDVRRLRAELGAAIIDRITATATAASSRQKGE